MAVSIPPLPDPASALVDSTGRISQEWYRFFNNAMPAIRLAASSIQDLPPVDTTLLHNNVSDTLTKGFLSALQAGGTHTFSTGTFTVDAADGSLQKLTNTGAHTWAQPANGTSVMVRVINGSGAGAIDITAFEAHGGDDFDTVVGNKFWASITAFDGSGVISIIADEANT